MDMKTDNFIYLPYKPVKMPLKCRAGEVSDGCHTFNELYDHRCLLFISLCNALDDMHIAWKSKKHEDGSIWDGWFIAGIYLGDNDDSLITYHLPDKYWDLLYVDEYATAPRWDGHTPSDVLNRLRKFNEEF